jgi:hypothetical protein
MRILKSAASAAVDARSGEDPRGAGAGWSHGRILAGGVSALTLAAVLLPIAENWRAEPRDSFPLSYYPMFALRRSKRTRFSYLLGIDARGGRRPLPYTLAGSGGLNQVRRQINRCVREGRAEALCERVAANPALARLAGPFADVVEVRIVTGEFRLGRFYKGETEPASERVHAFRRVSRPTACDSSMAAITGSPS